MTKRIAVTAVIAGILLALSVFVLPDYRVSTSTETQDGVFLETGLIDVDWNIDSKDGEQEKTTHFLGEEFPIEFVFQYKHDIVEVLETSLEDIPIKPFDEVRGSERSIKLREINDEISELRYTVYVRFVDVQPGNAYSMEPIEARYMYISSGNASSIDITPPHAFQVSTRCGFSPQTCNFRLLADNFEDNSDTFVMALKAAAALFVLSAVFVILHWVLSWRRGRVENSEDKQTEIPDFISQLADIKDEIQAMSDHDIHDARVNELMLQLKALSYRMALHFRNVHAYEWDRGPWPSLSECLNKVHSKAGAVRQDAEVAVRILEEIFAEEIKARERKMFPARIFSNTKNKISKKEGR